MHTNMHTISINISDIIQPFLSLPPVKQLSEFSQLKSMRQRESSRASEGTTYTH